jgi:phenylalanyl-tRNA synthetase beta chain
VLVSYRWLGRHVDLDGIAAEEVAHALTIHTAEVDGVRPFAPWLHDVVVGEVVACERHPDADRLSVCRVDVGPEGDGEPLQIVCGATNVARGQKVAVGRVGTVLPGDLKLAKAKIRGVESRGMICSERELGLGEEHAGIWVLSADAEVGRPVAEAAGTRDWVIEVDNKSLTHRPDLWGHRGFAAEVAALFGRALQPLSAKLPATEPGAPYPVRVETEGCPRYIGLAIDGVRDERSPDWLRFLLLAVEQRPIDLLVDLSNFVMLDLGQPNHLFDRQKLSPEGIVVRDARPGETIVTLDEVERRLTPEDVLICSGDTPVALAGVMGGQGSKVEETTGELLLEVATFHPTRVRRTAARLGLRTDASARFEKSLDPTLPAKAAAHFVRLLRELQPEVRLPRPMGDDGRWSDPARTVALRPDRVRAVLGASIADGEIERILTALGFGVSRGATWQVAVPSARATKDIGIEEDLIEEVGRVHGYGRIAERSLVASVEPPPRDERRALVRRLQDRLSGAARFHEALTHTFQSDELLAQLGLADEPHVAVVNPVVEGTTRVRRAVLPSLIGLLPHNRRHRDEVRLYEIGKGYLPERANQRGEPAEVHQLALVWTAKRESGEPSSDARLLHRLQGVIDDLVAHAGRQAPAWRGGEAGRAPGWAHPRKWLELRRDGADRALCVLAELEPGIRRELELVGEHDSVVALAELSLDLLLAAPAAPPGYRPIPRFPGVKVDVAVAAPEALSAGEVAAAIRVAGRDLVESLELFDLYRGESVGPGRKSLAYHLLLQAADRTLGEEDVARFLERLERAVAASGAELRRD